MLGKAVERTRGRASQLVRPIGTQAKTSVSQDLKPFRTSAGETFRPALWASSAYWMWIGWRGVICRQTNRRRPRREREVSPSSPPFSRRPGSRTHQSVESIQKDESDTMPGRVTGAATGRGDGARGSDRARKSQPLGRRRAFKESARTWEDSCLDDVSRRETGQRWEVAGRSTVSKQSGRRRRFGCKWARTQKAGPVSPPVPDLPALPQHPPLNLSLPRTPQT